MDHLSTSGMYNFKAPKLPSNIMHMLEGIQSYGNKNTFNDYMDKNRNRLVRDFHHFLEFQKSRSHESHYIGGGIVPIQKLFEELRNMSNNNPYPPENFHARPNVNLTSPINRHSPLYSEYRRRKNSSRYQQQVRYILKEDYFNQPSANTTAPRKFDTNSSQRIETLNSENYQCMDLSGQHDSASHESPKLDRALNLDCNQSANSTGSPNLDYKTSDDDENQTCFVMYDSDSDTEYVDECSILAQHKKKYLKTLNSNVKIIDAEVNDRSKELMLALGNNGGKNAEPGLDMCCNDTSLGKSYPKVPYYQSQNFSEMESEVNLEVMCQDSNSETVENYMNGISQQSRPIDYSVTTASPDLYKTFVNNNEPNFEENNSLHCDNASNLNNAELEHSNDTVARYGCVLLSGMSSKNEPKDNKMHPAPGRKLESLIKGTQNSNSAPSCSTPSETLTLTYGDVEMLCGKNEDGTTYIKPGGCKKTLEDFLNRKIAELINDD